MQTNLKTFNVARSPNGSVDAFYFAFEPEKVEHVLINEDPFTSNWLRHMNENPLAPGSAGVGELKIEDLWMSLRSVIIKLASCN